jgi:Fanconi anemia group M protein
MEQDAAEVSIVVDDRENAPELLLSLREEYEISCTVQRLPLGDYRLQGTGILVERKREDDFAASVISGRLFSQASRLAKSRCVPLILLEDMPDPDWLFPLSQEARLGVIASLALDFGIPVLPSTGEKESAFLLATLLNHRQRDPTATVRKGYRPRRLRSRLIFVLSGFPGLGRTKAAAVLEHFGSLRRAFAANEVEWRNAQGVGDKIASQIAHLLDQPFQGD